ncbi:AAA family ATPase, partial [Hallella sp.]|uniref:ATP-binding protein n=1 Tax=Hallella sp. TaxID=2980186 RepID=UPI003080CF87
MDKNVIKHIILSQQEFVSKIQLQTRPIVLEPNINYVLVGMRRAGKSYMLYQYIQQRLREGHLAEEILFVNFEDERIADMQKEDLHLILEAYRELYDHKPIIFLDEIQNVSGWEHFARRLADEKYRVLITGSNAHMLSREISSTLGGRYLAKEIHPFSFGEYLEYHNVHLTDHWELSPMRADVIR